MAAALHFDSSYFVLRSRALRKQFWTGRSNWGLSCYVSRLPSPKLTSNAGDGRTVGCGLRVKVVNLGYTALPPRRGGAKRNCAQTDVLQVAGAADKAHPGGEGCITRHKWRWCIGGAVPCSLTRGPLTRADGRRKDLSLVQRIRPSSLIAARDADQA